MITESDITYFQESNRNTGPFGEKFDELCALAREGLAMRSLLESQCFYAGPEYSRQGFTLDTDSTTAFRDIDYRDCPLYTTAKDAVDAAVRERLSGEEGR